MLQAVAIFDSFYKLLAAQTQLHINIIIASILFLSARVKSLEFQKVASQSVSQSVS